VAKDITLLNVDGKILTRQSLLDRLDAAVVSLYQTGGDSEIRKALAAMDAIRNVSGLGYAKLLYGWGNWYTETGQAEKRNDEFVDMIESDYGTRPVTTKRYILTWSYIEDCTIPKEIQNRPMDDLIKIATTLDNDHEITAENWKELNNAANSAEVRDILRKIKGQAPRKSSTRKVLSRNGSLDLYDSTGGKHFVGNLDVNSNDELVLKFIRQLVQNLGVEEK
jgi:hypothetical protein